MLGCGGALGNGSPSSSVPVDVAGLSSAEAVSAGGSHTCALTSAGGVRCWGSNQFRQLGDGTTTDRSTPVAVTGLDSGVVFDQCRRYTYLRSACGRRRQMLGPQPLRVPRGRHHHRSADTGRRGRAWFRRRHGVTAGDGHTCATTTSGAAKCWGSNAGGQVGDGTRTGGWETDRLTPVDVVGLGSGTVAVAAGDARASASVQVCVGGDGDCNPAMVSSEISHSCALTNTGSVKCWGWNAEAQLGDGTTAEKVTPVGGDRTRIGRPVDRQRPRNSSLR